MKMNTEYPLSFEAQFACHENKPGYLIRIIEQMECELTEIGVQSKECGEVKIYLRAARRFVREGLLEEAMQDIHLAEIYLIDEVYGS